MNQFEAKTVKTYGFIADNPDQLESKMRGSALIYRCPHGERFVLDGSALPKWTVPCSFLPKQCFLLFYSDFNLGQIPVPGIQHDDVVTVVAGADLR